ncbi:MAG: hypothetical protein NZ805_00575 [Armatimonadetes bacterium]|nr:hypothetical protein [Armatimonadota bacterium]MDW8027710.1 hypothetical protein [Armatimonadota bacterium]
MLPASVVRQVNDALAKSNLKAALEALSGFQDLRWHDLPPLDKKAVSSFGEKLQNDPYSQQLLAEAMFSENRTLRLFSKRLLQSLKHPPCIAKPLRLAFESYLHKTPAIPFSYRPDEAAKRREQNEIVENAFSMLLKIDPDEFLDLIAKILPDIAEAQKRKYKAQEIEKQMRERAEEIFAKRFGHLGIDFIEMPSRLRREFNEIVAKDQEFQRLERELQELVGESQTLLEDGEIVRYAVSSVLHDATRLDRNKEPSEIGQKLCSRFWHWVEDGLLKGDIVGLEFLYAFYSQIDDFLGESELLNKTLPLLISAKQSPPQFENLKLRELWLNGFLKLLSRLKWTVFFVRAEELPKELTPAAVLSLKIGEKEIDRMVDDLASELRSKRGEEVNEFSAFEDLKHKIVENFQTIDERTQALLKPPVVEEWLLKNYGQIPEILDWAKNVYISRGDLIWHWSQQPDWQSQMPILREKVIPVLMQKVHEIASEMQALKSRRKTGKEIALKEIALTESEKQILTEREQKSILGARKQRRLWELEEELEDIFKVFAMLGTPEIYQQLLDKAEKQKSKVWLEIVHIAVTNAPSDLQLLKMMKERVKRWNDKKLLSIIDDKVIYSISDQCYLNWLKEQDLLVAHRVAISPPFPRAELPKPAPELLPILEEAMNVRKETDFTENANCFGVSALYCFGTKETKEKVKAILQSNVNILDFSYLLCLAILRRDYELIPSLLKHARYWLYEPDFVAFFETLLKEAPQELPEVTKGVLNCLAEETDKQKAKIAIKMLEKILDRLDLFESNLDSLLLMVDSVLPEVAIFGMERLRQLVQAGLLKKEILRDLSQKLGEKVWSDQTKVTKSAVELLTTIGESDAEFAPSVIDALIEALGVNTKSVVELAIKGIAKVVSKHSTLLPKSAEERIQDAVERFSIRPSKPLQRLLSSV